MSKKDTPARRLGRLRQIAEEYTEEIYDAEATDELAGREPVAPLAAVTSEGSPESSHYGNGNLIISGSAEEMADRLEGELSEGWISSGRVWDLRADEFDICGGNVPITVSVCLGEGHPAAEVYTAQVEGREDGLYVFSHPGCRNAFATAVESEGRRRCIREAEPVNDEAATKRLIAAEVGGGEGEERERSEAIQRGDQLEALGLPNLAADVRTGLPLTDALLRLRSIGEGDSEAAFLIRSWRYGIPL